MGLDMSLYRLSGSYKSGKEDYFGEEIRYWRKYYPLDQWIKDHCEQFKHEYRDVYAVSIDNFKKLKEDVLSEDFNEYMQQNKDLVNFIDSDILKNEGYTYYYEYCF